MDTSNFKEVFESPKVKTLTAQVAELEAEVMRLREALIACRAHIGDPANFDCYGSDKELAEFLQQVKRDEDVAIAKADEALSTPFTPTTLNELIEKVEKMTIERCVTEIAETADMVGIIGHSDRECLQVAICALPTGQIKLEELL